jgi:hypothetical protein
MENSKLTPKFLDMQSDIFIDRWLDADSEEFKKIDDNPEATKLFLRVGFQEPSYFFVDSLSRVWGKCKNGSYAPFHMSYNGTNIGIKIAKKASN